MTDIVVIARLVPDLVEELEIAPSGTALDLSWLRLIINEFDNHAIEQAVILKEKTGSNNHYHQPGSGRSGRCAVHDRCQGSG